MPVRLFIKKKKKSDKKECDETYRGFKNHCEVGGPGLRVSRNQGHIKGSVWPTLPTRLGKDPTSRWSLQLLTISKVIGGRS